MRGERVGGSLGDLDNGESEGAGKIEHQGRGANCERREWWRWVRLRDSGRQGENEKMVSVGENEGEVTTGLGEENGPRNTTREKLSCNAPPSILLLRLYSILS
ncbi:unnamed protein product [Sphenostylis stenocarpa]|uniref:Uncharacterized protein n=1 Tax=Sphenostylis stenocarpa TaxID=92480 RepID=A0AA86S0F5_9FABA|nr:unnamed protein product [Sphenostylis stenocarpa]